MKRMDVERRTILVGLTGSYGYGLNRPDSDRDYRGIFIAGKDYYLGFDRIEQKDSGWDTEPGIFDFLTDSEDTVIYELRKVLPLLAGANPNVLEILWLREYPVLTAIGQKLIDNRNLFLSKKIKYTYSGYAFAQIKKIESHRKWLLNPPEQKPVPKDFDLDDETVLRKDELNAFLEYLYDLIRGKIEYLEEAEKVYQLLIGDIDFKGLLKQYPLPDYVLERTQEMTRSRGDFIRLLQKSQKYQIAIKEWKAYCSWRENRNLKRAEMERKSGFDLKHAMHCIRLLRSGVDIMRRGEVIVDRRDVGDAEELRSILNGDYNYDAIMAMADSLMAEMEVAYRETSLPHHVDLQATNDLCIELVEMQGFADR